MENKTSIFFSLLLLLSSLMNPAYGNSKVIVLGDSLSSGYGISYANTWVNEINNYWNKNHPDLTIINVSISATTTSSGVSRLPDIIDMHNPDLVFIVLGGNDGLRGVDMKTMEDNIVEMIDIARLNNVYIAISEINMPPNYGDRYTKRFNQVFHDVSKYMDVPLIPFFMHEIILSPELIQADGIHPNDDAQKEIAKILEPQLRRLIK